MNLFQVDIKFFARGCCSFTVLLLLLICNVLSAEEKHISDKVIIEYFFQPDCSACEKVSTFILPQLEERYSGFYRLDKYDTSNEKSVIRLTAYHNKFKVTDNKPVCMIINGKEPLLGYKEIEARLFGELDSGVADILNKGGVSVDILPAVIEKKTLSARAETFAISGIIIAGLIDGINPCVFSTLIFFVSLLVVSKIKGSKIILAGSSYCLACFITYYLMGYGAMKFLEELTFLKNYQLEVNIGMTVILLVFAMISFKDAIKFKLSGKAKDVTFQLPDSLKNKIHKIMKCGLSFHFLIPGAFMIGVLVTIIESACTGQVYIPVLAAMARNADTFSKWHIYLLLYNLMFILPLVLIFTALYFGIKMDRLLKWSKKEVVISKILMTIFFILLAASFWLLPLIST